MTKHKTSTSPDVQAGLKLAKAGRFDEALAIVDKVDARELSVAMLRSLALVYSYCGREGESAKFWDEVCRTEEATIGDRYMLASSLAVVGQIDRAEVAFRKVIEVSQNESDSSYLGVSAIHLAHLLSQKGHLEEAEEVLAPFDASEGTHIHGVGYVTKGTLLGRLGR